MNDRTDTELKSRFAELRAQDAASAPPFRRPAPGSDPPARFPFALAAGVLLAAGAAIGYLTLRRPTPLPSVSDIVAWRAPTDVLLRFPGRPPLTGSVIDRFIPSTALFPGDQP